MSLMRTLAGAIIGAAVGLGLHLIVGAITKSESAWFAIAVGACTGLGVLLAVRGPNRGVSYLRGAVSALVGLAAILGALSVVRLVIAQTELKTELADRIPTHDVDMPIEPAPATDVAAETDVPADTKVDPAESEPPADKEPTAETDKEPAADSEPATDNEPPADNSAETKETSKVVATPPSQPTKPAAAPITPASLRKSVELRLRKTDLWDFLYVTIGVILAYELARGSGRKSASGATA